MNYVFEMREIPAVAVAGTEDSFPVHRIYCVGQNYAKHAREMGANPERENLQMQFVRKGRGCHIL